MPAQITPQRYHLRIAPDLNRFAFDGRMTLRADANGPTETILLDCAELAVWHCRIRTGGADSPFVDCRFTVDPIESRLTVHVPGPLAGRFELTIDYAGKINDRMAGFYRSGIRGVDGPDHIAVTQFQESDARRAFPCFDQPACKAVFHIEMLVDKALTAISNTEIEAIAEMEDGRKRVTFAATPKMSTYLLFFGVGPFEIQTDAVDQRVRAACLPAQQDQTLFGREFGRKALAYGEAYFAVDYPLSKMDLIAVPDFAFGAMENWGAITFRENLLLDVPGVTSREARARICEIIAHEVTHQWFGNLVTPQDWKYLWLNESFATYFGYGMVDHYHPQWQVWHQFIRNQTETALTRDALNETIAIEMPGDSPVAINTSTAPIIYSKGGSVLRQLEAWIGPDHFKSGLRRYLADFAYGCAASHHLWESLATASGLPVVEMMSNWVTQPGFPLISARRKGNRLTLEQRRFTYLPTENDQTWMVPVTVTAYRTQGQASTRQMLLHDQQAEVTLPPDTAAYKLNHEQQGCYHVHYADADNWVQLGTLIRERRLGAVDRWGVQNDLFALVKGGRMEMAAFVQLAENFRGDTAYLPLSSLDSHLFEAYLVLEGEMKVRAGQTARVLIDAAVDAIGRAPADDEPLMTAMLRDQLLGHGCLIGSHAIRDPLVDQFDAFVAGTPIAPDIFKSVLIAGATSGGQAALEAIIGRFESSGVEHERTTLAAALGAFGQWEQLAQALEYSLDKLPDRLRFIPLVAAAGNPSATDRLWPWFEDHFTRLAAMHPLLFERVVAAFIPIPGLQDPRRTQSCCDQWKHQQPHLQDVIALSLERLEINSRLRERERSQGQASN